MHLIWRFAFKKKKIIAVVLVPLSNYVSINNNKKKIQVEIKGSRFGSENPHLIIFHYLNHIHSTFSHSLVVDAPPAVALLCTSGDRPAVQETLISSVIFNNVL